MHLEIPLQHRVLVKATVDKTTFPEKVSLVENQEGTIAAALVARMRMAYIYAKAISTTHFGRPAEPFQNEPRHLGCVQVHRIERDFAGRLDFALDELAKKFPEIFPQQVDPYNEYRLEAGYRNDPTDVWDERLLIFARIYTVRK